MFRHLPKIIFPLLCAFWIGGVLYLIPDDRLEYLKGPTEDSYWGIAQLQLQNSELANLVIKMDTPNPPAHRDLLIAFALLQSRAYMISQRSVTTEYVFDDPVYQEGISRINASLHEIETTKLDLQNNPQVSTYILNKLGEVTVASQKIVSVIGVLGIQRRDALLRDINSKYSLLFYGELVVSLFFIAASAYFSMARRSALRMLEAEQNARRMEHEIASEAEKATATVRVFLATISHELKNPMQTLVTGLENLSERNVAPSSMRTLLNMERAVARITTHLDEIGDFLTLGVDGLALDFSEFRVDELLTEIVGDLHNDKSRVCPEIRITESAVVCVRTDRLRIKQIVYNLADNAVKHAETMSIEMGFDVDDDEGHPVLEVTVSDRGMGISESDLPHIFDPFYRVHKQHRIGLGLGMGLTIASGLVKRLRGSLAVKSQTDRGTTFTVRVPVERCAVGHAMVALVDQAQEDVLDAKFTDQRMLVIDDQETICLELSALATSLGMRVDYVLDADNAREACSRHMYDIVLCDIHLAQDDGFALADQLKIGLGNNTRTRIVAISGYMTSSDFIDDPRSFDGFIEKPFTRKKLVTSLNAIT
ncbi:response regulator [Paraburkholderia megapolitana]|uniref:histidine kinase n=1 Tax=Paraburkholderia megapolitana TaxID=420953 RepID=A0A1I3UG74_9BURK|nr:response regulator [Paraburkholderia megapolitana]SFJ80777.1 Signal transduction histidine kinase [Paraburkholderia megapolitana]